MKLDVGTRGSQLAWTQTGMVVDELQARHPGLEAQRVRIVTRGDKDQSTPLPVLAGTGLFTKELEHALLQGEIDLAVHSLKDVPFLLAPGCELAAFLPREDARDALLTPHGSLEALPQGACVGTSSPRRVAQLRAARPDLRFADLRGNLDTRLRRLEEGQYDAIVLAVAGLARLGWTERIAQRLDAGICLPAFGQGVLVVEARADRPEILELLRSLDHAPTREAALLERQVMQDLGGGCKAAIACYAQVEGTSVRVRACAGDPATGVLVREEWNGSRLEAPEAARRLAATLRARGVRCGVQGLE